MKLLRSKTFILILVVLVLVAYGVLGMLQTRRPDVPAVQAPEGGQPGYPTVTMVVDLMRAQLESFGGWLPNDPPPSPGWALDDTPHFQLGVLQVVRHAARVLRDNLTRQRTSDAVHKEVDLAYSAYANDPYKWAFPSAEGAFRRGNEALLRFRDDLGGNAHFYPRADNLVQLLEPLVSELGGVNTRLLEAQRGDVAWMAIDDNFYTALGTGYAMLGVMRAVREDFRQVLADKNAEEITDLIIASLEEAQFAPWIVTNGARDGILANHSSNLKVFLDDARQKMGSLITILRQG